MTTPAWQEPELSLSGLATVPGLRGRPQNGRSRGIGASASACWQIVVGHQQYLEVRKP